jgi:hypothetical protein
MSFNKFTHTDISQRLQDHFDKAEPNSTRLYKLLEMTSTIREDKRVVEEGLVTSTRFDFQPKAVFFTSDSKDNKKFGLLEYSNTALGLKDIGVMQAYARLANPDYAYILCAKSISKELSYVLADPATGANLLRINDTKNISLIDFV